MNFVPDIGNSSVPGNDYQGGNYIHLSIFTNQGIVQYAISMLYGFRAQRASDVAPRINVCCPLIQNLPPNVLCSFHDFLGVMCFPHL